MTFDPPLSVNVGTSGILTILDPSGNTDFDFAPADGSSPLVDLAPPGLAPDRDLLGAPRPFDGNNDGTLEPDLGAFEFGSSANQAPIADAGFDQPAVECAGPGGASVTLDGSESDDPDMDTLTYTWTGPFPESPVTGIGPQITLSLGGPHTVTLTVEDPSGETDSDTVDITVKDTASPILTLATDSVEVTPTTPGGGAVVDVIAASGAIAEDLCDPSPVISHDWPGGEFPVSETTEVTITATDASGNAVSRMFSVTVVQGPPSDPEPPDDPGPPPDQGPPPDTGPPDGPGPPPDQGPPDDPGPPA